MNTPPLRAGLRRLALSQLMAASCSLAFAQTPPTSTREETVELTPFSVSTTSSERYRAAESISAVRVRTPLIDTPSSISVLTRDFINDIAPLRVYDATRYLAGVQEGRGITFGDRQIIRGFESEGRNVDNFASGGSTNFDEALIDRIEVTKGPNAILSPAGSPGGSLNIVSKSPRFVQERSVTALVGTFDAQKITLDMTDKLGGSDKLAYRLIGAWQDSRRYWDDDAKVKRKLLSPMLTWRIDNSSELTLKYFYLKAFLFREPMLILDPSVVPGVEPILGPGFKAKSINHIQPWSGIPDEQQMGSALYTKTFNEHLSTRLAGRVFYNHHTPTQEFFSTPGTTNRYNPVTGDFTQDYTWALQNTALPYNATTNPYVSTFSRYYDPANIPVRGELGNAHDRFLGWQNDWVYKVDTTWAKFQTVAGAAQGYTKATNERTNGTLPSINLNTPAVAAFPVWLSTKINDSVSTTESWQAYLNQRVAFLDDRVSLTGGFLHYDVFSKSFDRAAALPVVSTLEDDKDMYMGALLVKPLKNLSLYYSYSTNATPAIVDNKPLWREGKQSEFGAKIEFYQGRLSVGVARFDIAQTNVSVPNPERLVNPAAPGALLSDLDNYGTELEIMGAVTKNISLVASATKLKMRDSLGRQIRSVADDLASLVVNYRFLDGTFKGLGLNAGFSYTGERAGDVPATNFTPLNVVTKTSFFIPAYTVFNVGASYTWDRYLFRLYVDNVNDDADYVQQAGARISGPGLGTATGRNIRFSATVKF